MTDLQHTEPTRISAHATEQAAHLMDAFAERTGLTSTISPRRYLWTDAFAVCNFLALARSTGEVRYADLALALVDQVHTVLGQHRDDDPRVGWLSGLPQEQGALHPTAGGLRIGKPLRERAPEEAPDQGLEWERDGQYFHYLTRWMHALDQVARYTGEGRFNLWARELAEVAHAAFLQSTPHSGGAQGVVWKMSIDLSRPLVLGRGQRDALDGLVTLLELRNTARGTDAEPSLDTQVLSFSTIIQPSAIPPSADPLDVGSLLTGAYLLWQIPQERGEHDALIQGLLQAALGGLASAGLRGALIEPIETRMAFRELGLSIGLYALDRMGQQSARLTNPEARQAWADSLAPLQPHVSLGRSLLELWKKETARQTALWTEHRDINEVMLATRLLPEGYLALNQSCADRPVPAWR